LLQAEPGPCQLPGGRPRAAGPPAGSRVRCGPVGPGRPRAQPEHCRRIRSRVRVGRRFKSGFDAFTGMRLSESVTVPTGTEPLTAAGRRLTAQSDTGTPARKKSLQASRQMAETAIKWRKPLNKRCKQTTPVFPFFYVMRTYRMDQDADYRTHHKRTVYGAALLMTVLLIILTRALAALWPGCKTSNFYRPPKVRAIAQSVGFYASQHTVRRLASKIFLCNQYAFLNLNDGFGLNHVLPVKSRA
jgi:hypothetical protein